MSLEMETLRKGQSALGTLTGRMSGAPTMQCPLRPRNSSAMEGECCAGTPSALPEIARLQETQALALGTVLVPTSSPTPATVAPPL